MTNESEVLLVAALDSMITKIDNALDELLDLDTPESRKTEHTLLDVSMELSGLMDRLVEDAEELEPEEPVILPRGC